MDREQSFFQLKKVWLQYKEMKSEIQKKGEALRGLGLVLNTLDIRLLD